VSFPLVPLKRVALDVTRGSTPTYSDDQSGDAWVLGQSCLRPDRDLDWSRGRPHVGAIPTKGRLFGSEVLINSTGTGTLGRAVALRGLPDRSPWFADSHVTVISLDRRKAAAHFVGYVVGLQGFEHLAETALSVGATKQKELNVQLVRRHRIPLPELDRQHAIADFLDRECARIADLHDSAQRLTSLLIEPALSRFSALTADLDVTQVVHHYQVLLGKMLDEGRPGKGEPVPYLRNQNVSWDRFDLTDIKQMPLLPDERHRYQVLPGDLLACEGRHVGKCAIWQGEMTPMYYQKALHRIRPWAQYSNRFLLWCLWLGNSRGDFYADGTGSTIPHLPAEKLRRVRIPAADRETQDAIVKETDTTARAAGAARDTAATLVQRLADYRDALITEAVTGQLDVTAVSDAQMDERAHAAAEGAGEIARDAAPVR
jgi:hypothetical protein